MNSGLCLQISVGEIAFDLDRDGFYAAFGLLHVENFRAIAAGFGPSEVHTQQHAHPVARFGPSGAGVYRQERRKGVELVAEELQNAQLFEFILLDLEARPNLGLE